MISVRFPLVVLTRSHNVLVVRVKVANTKPATKALGLPALPASSSCTIMWQLQMHYVSGCICLS